MTAWSGIDAAVFWLLFAAVVSLGVLALAATIVGAPVVLEAIADGAVHVIDWIAARINDLTDMIERRRKSTSE